MTSAAIISPCGTYRYTLHRSIPSVLRWVKPCLFVMLNPSTADATKDDPTIRRCVGFAKREGCTGMTVVNLFALRATDPADLAIAAPDQFREACPITVTSANGASLFWILSEQADVAWVKVNEFYEREDARILDEQQ